MTDPKLQGLELDIASFLKKCNYWKRE